jgi:hypothetical protein
MFYCISKKKITHVELILEFRIEKETKRNIECVLSVLSVLISGAQRWRG